MRTKRDLNFWLECRDRLPSVAVAIRFPSEEHCRARLTEVRWPEGFVCPRCGGRETWQIARGTLTQCAACKAQISITADTVLKGSRLPVQVWFLGAERLIQGCSLYSLPVISDLAHHLGLHSTAARRLRDRLLIDIQSDDSLLLRCICDPRPPEGRGREPQALSMWNDELPNQLT